MWTAQDDKQLLGHRFDGGHSPDRKDYKRTAALEFWDVHSLYRPTSILNRCSLPPTFWTTTSLTCSWPQLSRTSSRRRTVRSRVTLTTTSTLPSVPGTPWRRPVFSSILSHVGPATIA